MRLAIIGATGSCGRQVAAQLLDRGILPAEGSLHLIGHAGGAHESELWGLRADLLDAFSDHAPHIEVGTDVAASDAEVVVMMAGATVTQEMTDRSQLAATNYRIFTEAAADVARMNEEPTIVVQSNPVELAMELFAGVVSRHRIIGAAAWSDSLRFRREIAAELGVKRPLVDAEMWGQHGDHLVPMWSGVRARGVEQSRIDDVVGRATSGRPVTQLPDEIRSIREHVVKLITRGEIAEAYGFIHTQQPDVRAAIKPLFTHFTAGRTTELATAHAVADVVSFLAGGVRATIPAQVVLDNEWPGLSGPLAVPVLIEPHGWSQVVTQKITDDEQDALATAMAAVATSNASATGLN
jgi:malate dehydrogenase